MAVTEDGQTSAATSNRSSPFDTAQNAGLSVGVCSEQGRRPYQEDEYAIRPFLSSKTNTNVNIETHFFGLYDGHAGGRCSKFVSTSLPDILAEDAAFTLNLQTAIKRAYHTTNEQFLKIADKLKLHDGSTGITSILRDGKLTVANVGDCRALIISSGKAVQMSVDQKPTQPEEQKRIAQLGGVVLNCMGVARVNGVLAVSRAFGNRMIKSVIRPDAEITTRELTRDDEFLVMASDGMWDVLRNKDVSDIVNSYSNSTCQQIADELVRAALSRGSMDNVTCIVVRLKEYALKCTNEKNMNIHSKRHDFLASNDNGTHLDPLEQKHEDNAQLDSLGFNRIDTEGISQINPNPKSAWFSNSSISNPVGYGNPNSGNSAFLSVSKMQGGLLPPTSASVARLRSMENDVPSNNINASNVAVHPTGNVNNLNNNGVFQSLGKSSSSVVATNIDNHVRSISQMPIYGQLPMPTTLSSTVLSPSGTNLPKRPSSVGPGFRASGRAGNVQERGPSMQTANAFSAMRPLMSINDFGATNNSNFNSSTGMQPQRPTNSPLNFGDRPMSSQVNISGGNSMLTSSGTLLRRPAPQRLPY